MLFVGLANSALCMTSCSKQPDFDAKSYVNLLLRQCIMEHTQIMRS